MKVISNNDKPAIFTKDSLKDFCKNSRSYKINKEQQNWLKNHTDIILSLHNEFLNNDLDTVAASRIESLSVKYLGENDPLVDGADFG
jgi:hypothetical protein